MTTERVPIMKSNSDSTQGTRHDKSNIKCVLVGDTAVGKSCLAARLTSPSDKFSTDYRPTMFDNYAVTTIVEGKPYVLSLFDTAGQDEYNRLRALAYMNSDVYLVCFSVVHPESLRRVMDTWVPEVTHYSPDTPLILVGTQIDKREEEEDPARQQTMYVQTREGIGAANKIGADCYVECSALTEEGILRLKEAAIESALSSHSNRHRGGDRPSDSTSCGCADSCSIV